MTKAGYKYFKTYQLATVIYDLTVQFTDRWVSSQSRTHDQMEQAARSGKQNIAEGYKKKAWRATLSFVESLGVVSEPLEDYEDFARQNKIAVWLSSKVREMREIREIWDNLFPNYSYHPSLPNDKEQAVNPMLTLCNQVNYLLDKQIESLKKRFAEEGGWTENIFRQRLKRRGQDW